MGLVRYIKNWFRHDRNMKQLLNDERIEIARLRSKMDDITWEVRENYIRFLRGKTLSSREMGVTDEMLCNEEIIVSLTSFGNRIYDVYLAVESIMQGTVKPNRIILWLSKEEFEGKPLPKMLELQRKRGLQVEYCEDVKSYNKLIPSLENYPEACIITIDDDAIYEYDIVERLVIAHCENANAICACRVHKVKFGDDKKPLSYMDWDLCVEEYVTNSNLLFPTGVGGVLYPPHCFPGQALDKTVFMDICRYADDVWFYAMRLMNDTPVIQVYTGKPNGYFMEMPSMNIDALSRENTNVSNCRNDVQIKAVFEKYNLYDKLL